MQLQPIEVWFKIVYHVLNPNNKSQEKLDSENIPEFIRLSQNAKDQFFENLLKELMQVKKEGRLKVWIEAQQEMLCQLLDRLADNEAAVKDDTIRTYYKSVEEDLLSGLDFMQKNSPRYFNHDLKVPMQLLVRYELAVAADIAEIRKELPVNGELNALAHFLIEDVEAQIHPTETAYVTFYQLAYLKRVITLLYNVGNNLGVEQRFPRFLESIIAINYNSPAFIGKVIQYFEQTSLIEQGQYVQLAYLRYLYKHTAQIVENPELGMYHTVTSIKHMLLDWLIYEIGYLEVDAQKEVDHDNNKLEKINVSTTVPVLALYIRLFKEAGIYTNNNVSELIRAASIVFTIGKKAEISKGHLHSKFYAIDPIARKTVSDQLVNMLNLCKKLQ